MDSDDDYDLSNNYNLNDKRRNSQSRNKFRKERDDYQQSSLSSSSNDLKSFNGSYNKYMNNNGNSNSSSFNNNNSLNRRYENEHAHQPSYNNRAREKYGSSQIPLPTSSRYESMRTPPLPSNHSNQVRLNNNPKLELQSNYDDYPSYSNGKRPSCVSSGPFNAFNGIYNSPLKKHKRDWPASFDSPSTNYYEHDNRLGYDYDEYGNSGYSEEYNNDYNNLSRPVNYSAYSSFNNGNINSNNLNPMMMNQMMNITQSMTPIMSQYINQMNGMFNQPQIGFNNNNTNYGNNMTQINQQMNQINEFPTQPRMLTFKEFLKTLTPDELKFKPESYRLNKYNEYKEEFRADQTLEFFNKHKLEDWFKLRYHPIESAKRKLEQRESIKNRLNIFINLLNSKKFDKDLISLDMTKDKNKYYLLKFLDACIIRLEGGLEDTDLDILDDMYKDISFLTDENKDSDLEEVNENKGESENEDEQKKSTKTKTKKKNSFPKQAPKINIDFSKIPQRTQSIFFKHLPVYVTRQDLERIGSKYEGYKRASISEPAPERGFQRRGWITYDSVCNIKDICSKINGTRVNENNKFQLNSTINRDLDQKIKIISGLSNHRDVIKQDLQFCIKIVQNMDKKWNLFENETSNLCNESSFSDRSNPNNNPFLQTAIDYLDQFKDDKKSENNNNEHIDMEKDEKASSLLDILILYLRIVHSIDYYNASEYQQEDYMPYRCGILHVRGSSLFKNDSNTVHVINGSQINYYDPHNLKRSQVNEWLRLFENHIRPYTDYREQIDLELAKKLGLKDQHDEIEKFIKKNCQKIDKDVWLCPLSGKKFKGPDYVRKHIETKHHDKLDELKLEIEYFNKFVLDPKRPYLPEHPMNRNMGKINQLTNSNNYYDEYEEFCSPTTSYMMMNHNQTFRNNNFPGLVGHMPNSQIFNNQFNSNHYNQQITMPQSGSKTNNYHHNNSSNNKIPPRR